MRFLTALVAVTGARDITRDDLCGISNAAISLRICLTSEVRVPLLRDDGSDVFERRGGGHLLAARR